MIVSAPFSASLFKIELSEDSFEKLAEELQKGNPTSGTFSFSPEELDVDQASGHLVVRKPTQVEQLNKDSGEIEQVTIRRTNLIPFRVDYEKQFLEVFSNQEDAAELEPKLGRLIDWEMTIKDTTLDLTSLYQYLKNSESECEVSSLRINNFSINEFTSGSYQAEVFDENEVERLLNEYGTNVSSIRLSVKRGQESMTVGLFRSGSMRIYNKTDEGPDLLEIVKDAISAAGKEVISDA